ncbi:MAG: HAD family hydrolase [Muribaculaceae bacterium]|nr:HAD family hydrolase [Muribaculaceae bacterium]
MTKVIAFDLDDTLIPEVLFLRSGIHHIADYISERYPKLPSLRIVYAMEMALLTHRNHYSALESLLEEFSLREAINMKDIVSEFRNHAPDPSIYHLSPSVADALTNLKQKNIKTALITDGRSITQRNKIKAAGLYSFFDDSDIYISEETGHDKYDPDNFLSVMKKFAGANEFYYVGDNPPKDFLHPEKLGWKTRLVHPFPLAIHQGFPKL